MLLMRRKEPNSRLSEYLDKMRERLQKDPICLTQAEADKTARNVTVQVLLSIGSRSFSHFLNILERFARFLIIAADVLKRVDGRYIDLLRDLTGSSAARLELLRIVSKFWRTNAQFRGIVIDKLLQYRVVDAADIVAHVFEGDVDGGLTDWSAINPNDVLLAAVNTVDRRLKASRKRVEALKRRQERKADALRAAGIKSDDVAMEDQEGTLYSVCVAQVIDSCPLSVDPVRPETATEAPAEDPAEAEELAAAEKALESNRGEQESVVGEVVRQFDKALSAPVGDGEEAKWARWWLRGWYKAFARNVRLPMQRPPKTS